MNRFRLTLAALVAIGAPGTAQLPTITVPKGVLRFDIGGALAPVRDVWRDGTKTPVGSLGSSATLGADATPLVSALEARLGDILGRSATPGSLGSLTTIAEQQRGTWLLGLAFGVTKRLTIFGTLPIVRTRTRTAVTHDGTGATLGVNPAHPTFGTAGGLATTTTFFGQFDQAIGELSTRVNRGDYANVPATLALAQQTLTNAGTLRGQLYTLLADPFRATLVLPTAESTDGADLFARIAQLQATFTDGLGVGGFNTQPALPATALTAEGFEELLESPDGFDVTTDDEPRVAIGDMELGAAFEVVRRGGPSSPSALSVWAKALARFPNGQLPRNGILLDQGTGDRQPDGEFSGIVDARRGRVGVRGEVTYLMQLPWNQLVRLGTAGQFLLPAASSAGIRRDLGDVTAMSVQPYLVFAPHLALTGRFEYWRKGKDRTAYATGQDPIAGNPALLDTGTEASAARLAVGITFSHGGTARDGRALMPVEASFLVERTVASGRGVVPSPLTTRIMFRVYKGLFTR